MECSDRKDEIFQGSVVKVFSSRPLCLASLHPTCDAPPSPKTAHWSGVALTLGGLGDWK